MNTAELVSKVATATQLPKSQVKAVVDNVVSTVKLAVKKGDTVQVTGFGSWKSVKRKARVGVNPATGEKINIAARKAVKFTTGKDFKQSVK